jgi:hypothetical protein
MSWYNYFFCFFAGMFLANVVPHFVHGISGDPFPTPFANPPGKGLSSATTNVVWALVNLIVGYFFSGSERFRVVVTWRWLFSSLASPHSAHG